MDDLDPKKDELENEFPEDDFEDDDVLLEKGKKPKGVPEDDPTGDESLEELAELEEEEESYDDQDEW